MGFWSLHTFNFYSTQAANNKCTNQTARDCAGTQAYMHLFCSNMVYIGFLMTMPICFFSPILYENFLYNQKNGKLVKETDTSAYIVV